jgi:hypothetical protein
MFSFLGGPLRLTKLALVHIASEPQTAQRFLHICLSRRDVDDCESTRTDLQNRLKSSLFKC